MQESDHCRILGNSYCQLWDGTHFAFAVPETSGLECGAFSPSWAPIGNSPCPNYSLSTTIGPFCISSVALWATCRWRYSRHRPQSGWAELVEEHPDVILLDVVLPGESGLEIIHKIRARDPQVPIIIITGQRSSDTAIEAMKRGAYDYLLKPLNVDTLRPLVVRPLEIRGLMQKTHDDDDEEQSSVQQDGLVGNSPQMQDVFKSIGTWRRRT